MPVSSFASIREAVRRTIRDTLGLRWDDTALDRIINDAQREYAVVAGPLVGSVPVTVGTSPVFQTPDDFISPLRFLGTDRRERPFISWKRLHESYPDFRSVRGTELCGIVPDFDGFGKLRVWPWLPDGTDAGTLYYRRTAAPDTVETTNVDAVIQYCLFHVFLISANPAADVYYRRFLSAAAREDHVQRGLATNSRVRHGRFF